MSGFEWAVVVLLGIIAVLLYVACGKLQQIDDGLTGVRNRLNPPS